MGKKIILVLIFCFYLSINVFATEPQMADYQALPITISASAPPIVMLTMSRDHTLYYAAYNDATDLDNDGVIETTFKPSIDYYGYFDCAKCYTYDTGNTRFNPTSTTANKKCTGTNEWSGNFLNYVSMSRMDCIRKVLYGGYRSTDTATETVLERAYIPQDTHSWGKYYENPQHDGYDITEYTPLSQPIGASRHIFVSVALADAGAPLLRVLENSGFYVWDWVSCEVPVSGDQAMDETAGAKKTVTDNSSWCGALVDVTANNTGGSASALVGAPIQGSGGSDITIPCDACVSADGYGSPAAETPPKAFDNNNDTKWLTWGGSSAQGFRPVWITYDLQTAQKITQYSITTGNDAEQRDPKTWEVRASNTSDFSSSVVVDSQSNGSLSSTRKNKKTFTCSNPPATGYRYYRLYITARKGSGNPDSPDCGSYCVQITEIELIGTATVTDTSPSLAFDDNNGSEWFTTIDPTTTSPAQISFTFTSARTIKSYSITTGSVENNDPKSWVLEASSDGGTVWTQVDSQTDGQLPAARQSKKSFICANIPTQAYTLYRFTITSKKSTATHGVSIAEIEMFESTQQIPCTATLTDYTVRVKVCDPTMLEDNSKQYTNGTYKPVGLLQKHGESNAMFFGLMTGSYTNNLDGGVLRKPISSITDEINSNTGQFNYITTPTVGGIIKTIDKFRIKDFSTASHAYSCGWIFTRPMNSGECRDWGNPLGELLYEAVRYFAGKTTSTTAFSQNMTDGNDNGIDIPLKAFSNPYTTFQPCSKPFIIAISNIYPSFDSDKVPGSYFNTYTGDLTPALNAQNLANTIFTNEGITNKHYIGQSATTYDNACTAKTTDGLGNIRGLCPEEPTFQGSYYSSSVAYYSHINDVNSASGDQKIKFYGVGLAPSLPKIQIPVGGDHIITLVPFAKSVQGGGIDASPGAFQPTCAILNYFLESITKTHGRFRINYSDVEQGSDWDMDMIAVYEYQVVDQNGNAVDDSHVADGFAVDIKTTLNYAAGGITQHAGYIISGTKKLDGTETDGTYLEIRDETSAGSDIHYYLDTPIDCLPGATCRETEKLPQTNTRRFWPNTTGQTVSTLLENPLYYACKWGGFNDKNGNNIPDLVEEWDENGDGIPDTYFYINNPGELEQKLNDTFVSILSSASSGSSASVLSTNNQGEGILVQAYYRSTATTGDKQAKWLGYLKSLFLDEYGYMREDTNQNHKLDIASDKVIRYHVDTDGNTTVRRYDVSSANPYPDESMAYSTITMEDILPVWDAGKNLAKRDISTNSRKILTYLDKNANGVVDSGEYISFNIANKTSIMPYLGIKDNTAYSYLGSTQSIRTDNLINYILGTDATGLRNRTLTIDAQLKVWRLGDIINSSPVVISTPPDKYHLIYGDQTYKTFYDTNKNKETIVIVGANDGMLHCFTSWVYDIDTGTYAKPSGASIAELIGDEIWSYIPQSLLPQLKWLPNINYAHVYYVDGTPKVFDAKIGGVWKTLVLGSLRFGGKRISVTDDFNGDTVNETKNFDSCYFLLDVTDRRNPVLLWEKAYNLAGFSTSMPAISRIDDSHWFIVLGSGPTAFDGTSNQSAMSYIIDLATGDVKKGFSLNATNDQSFVNSVTAIDSNLDFKVDTFYYAKSYLDTSVWKGKVYALRTFLTGASPNYNPDTQWTNSVIFNADGPITSPISISSDDSKRVWLYFGTGRFLSNNDKADTSTQYLVGMKDPVFNLSHHADLLDKNSYMLNSNQYEVTQEGYVLTNCSTACTKYGTTGAWSEFIQDVRTNYDGWYKTLTGGERCITKPSILRGTVFMTSYTPTTDTCSYGGYTNLYGLYYETGTAYTDTLFIGDATAQDFSLIDLNNDSVFDINDIKIFDISGDGNITADDFTALHQFTSMQDLITYLTARGKAANVSLYDLNGDGLYTNTDLEILKQKLDLNKDGTVDAEDFAKLLKLVDFNKDNVVNLSDITQVDKNSDNKLSVNEFLLPHNSAGLVSVNAKVSSGDPNQITPLNKIITKSTSEIGAPPPMLGIHSGSEVGVRAFLQQSTGAIAEKKVSPAFNIKSGLAGWRIIR